MVSSGPQLARRVELPIGTIVAAGPPSTGTLFKTLFRSLNPIDSPSAEKKG